MTRKEKKMPENVTKALFEANAALNAQEFANRQILLKGSGIPTMIAPFGAEYIDASQTPPNVYRQIDAGVANNWVEQGGSGGGSSVNGAIFITDIEPQDLQDNVGGKVFSSDGVVLDSATMNTDLIRVYVLAGLGHSNYKPEVTVEGESVALSQNEDQSIWEGYVDIDREGSATITATHEDGATYTVNVTTDVAPEVQTALFENGYPNTQTELKEDDTFQLNVITDLPMTRIEVLDSGAGKSQTFDFPATTNTTVSLAIADRGNSSRSFGARIRTMNANGSYGSPFDTDSIGSENGVHVLNLNNLHPTGLIDAIQYPVGQVAIKDSESAGVDLSASNYDTLIYESENGELQFTNPTLFEAYKQATRISGDYNVSEDNVQITMTRTANGAALMVQEVVAIAHVVPQISITEPATRLKSGGNQSTQAQNHQIRLTSNQKLLEAPTISAPHGTLLNSMVDTGDSMAYTQDLRVHDDDEKGVFTFGLTLATNLAGKTVVVFNGEANYELGGFVVRTLTVPAFENEVDMGVRVANPSKVVAKDKDLALLTYYNDLENNDKAYTITNPSGVLNINGDLFHWNDSQAVNNNTTGLATIQIEEVE
jgi:hypothetical protein